MQKRLHNFMDKMQEKSVEERRKILFGSTTFLGVFIAIFGLWNISNNLVSLNTSDTATLAVEEKAEAPSPFASLSDNVAGVWASLKDNLRDLNDKLGTQEGDTQAVVEKNADQELESGESIPLYDQNEITNNEIPLEAGIAD
jgi:hypothetical protein